MAPTIISHQRPVAVLTPRFAPSQQQIVYMAFTNNRPRIYTYNVATGQQRLVVDAPNMTLSPRFSPNGQSIVYSMSVGGNTQIYRVPAGGGSPVRLTNAPGSTPRPATRPTAVGSCSRAIARAASKST